MTVIASEAKQSSVLTLTLIEVRGFSPRTIYERRSLSSKNEFDLEFDLEFNLLSFNLNLNKKGELPL